MKVSTKSIKTLKNKEQIVAITAYDAISAGMATEAGVDIILVGDSLGNSVLGYETTVPVSLEMIAYHTSAVARVKPEAIGGE